MQNLNKHKIVDYQSKQKQNKLNKHTTYYVLGGYMLAKLSHQDSLILYASTLYKYTSTTAS